VLYAPSNPFPPPTGQVRQLKVVTVHGRWSIGWPRWSVNRHGPILDPLKPLLSRDAPRMLWLQLRHSP
jgi:hypothetical protein